MTALEKAARAVEDVMSEYDDGGTSEDFQRVMVRAVLMAVRYGAMDEQTNGMSSGQFYGWQARASFDGKIDAILNEEPK